MRESIIAKRSAHQKLVTVNPGTIIPANNIRSALITKIKRPNVTIVNGRVRSNRIGFMNVFKTPKTIARIMIVPRLAIWIPGRI